MSSEFQVALKPENIVFDAKRLSGRNLLTPVVQSDFKLWPFKCISGDGDKPICAASERAQRAFLISRRSCCLNRASVTVRF